MADVLSDALNRVNTSPSCEKAWLQLAALPKLCLRLPPRSGRKKAKAFESSPHLVRLLSLARDHQWRALFEEASSHVTPKGKRVNGATDAAIIRSRVISLVEDGQLSKAVKALHSQGLHQLSPTIVKSLADKHPPGQSLPLVGADHAPFPRLSFTTEEVLKALASFNKGSAPGASRLRAIHISDALSTPTADAHSRLSGPLAGVVTLLANGEAPISIARWLAGAPLFPLRKHDGGVRPIAVGEVLRRLVSKVVCKHLVKKCGPLLEELGQFGVGVKGGAEAVVHAVRKVSESFPSIGILKIDLRNAFNEAERPAILEEIRLHRPEAEQWFRFCYDAPAVLLCDDTILPFSSTRGVQQGDPLGPFFFALAILPCLRRLRQELTPDTLALWYLDDGVVVGPPEQLSLAFGIISESVAKAGLTVNSTKCEFYCANDEILCPSTLGGVRRIPAEGFELLGCPIGSDSFCSRYVSHRVDKITAALSQLQVIDDPQIETILIRSCLGIPKFGFALRSAPPSQISPAVRDFDNMMEEVFLNRLGLSLTPQQLAQLHLPIAMGGLGLLRADDVAESAYIGSLLTSLPRLGRILHHEIALSDFHGSMEALVRLRSFVPALPSDINLLPTFPDLSTRHGVRHPQEALTARVHTNAKDKLVANALSPRDKLRLNAVVRPHAADWLSLPPIPSLGLKLTREEFLALLRWWLGLEIYCGAQNLCPEPKCHSELDQFGDHAVICPCGPSRIGRHDAVNHMWAFILKAFGFACQLEVMIDPGSQHRSADTLVSDWRNGADAAHDWIVTHLIRHELTSHPDDPNRAVTLAEAHKNSYARSRCEGRGIVFIPLAADTFGGFGAEAEKAFQTAVARGKLYRGNAELDVSCSVSSVRARLQLASLKGVARQLLRRVINPEHELTDEPFSSPPATASSSPTTQADTGPKGRGVVATSSAGASFTISSSTFTRSSATATVFIPASSSTISAATTHGFASDSGAPSTAAAPAITDPKRRGVLGLPTPAAATLTTTPCTVFTTTPTPSTSTITTTSTSTRKPSTSTTTITSRTTTPATSL